MMEEEVVAKGEYFRELEKKYHSLAEEAKAYKDGSRSFFQGMEIAFGQAAEAIETVLLTD